ncbi:MAG: hypothetical protein AAF628_12895 [Planctomycetota bacterium]
MKTQLLLLCIAMTAAVLAFSSSGTANGPHASPAFPRLLASSVEQLEGDRDHRPHDEEVAIVWNPVSVSVTSGCQLSACLASGCSQSGCLGSFCAVSGCQESTCLNSGCLASLCVFSSCIGSTCLHSGCCFVPQCGGSCEEPGATRPGEGGLKTAQASIGHWYEQLADGVGD